MRTWDTGTMAPAQQFGYWREVLCEAFTALDSVPRVPGGHRSTVLLHEVDQINAVELMSFAQDVIRGRSEIHRRADEFFFANLQIEGCCTVEQDGRQIEVTPGSFYLVDTTRPYRLHFQNDFRALSFRLPHRHIECRLANPRRFTAVKVDATSAVGGLAVNHMLGLMRCAPGLDSAVASRLSAMLAELLSIAVSAQVPRVASGQDRRLQRETFRQSIVSYVEAHALEARLSVDSVARQFCVSPRYVHGVFADLGSSFTQLTVERRLQAAAHRLAQPCRPAIATVAADCGFGDLSHFGRTFRRRFGCTPRQWRGQTTLD